MASSPIIPNLSSSLASVDNNNNGFAQVLYSQLIAFLEEADESPKSVSSFEEFTKQSILDPFEPAVVDFSERLRRLELEEQFCRIKNILADRDVFETGIAMHWCSHHSLNCYIQSALDDFADAERNGPCHPINVACIALEGLTLSPEQTDPNDPNGKKKILRNNQQNFQEVEGKILDLFRGSNQNDAADVVILTEVIDNGHQNCLAEFLRYNCQSLSSFSKSFSQYPEGSAMGMYSTVIIVRDATSANLPQTTLNKLFVSIGRDLEVVTHHRSSAKGSAQTTKKFYYPVIELGCRYNVEELNKQFQAEKLAAGAQWSYDPKQFYSRQDIRWHMQQSGEQFTQGHGKVLARIVGIHLPGAGATTDLRPAQATDAMEFASDLTSALMSNHLDSDPPIIVGGDFNCDQFLPQVDQILKSNHNAQYCNPNNGALAAVCIPGQPFRRGDAIEESSRVFWDNEYDVQMDVACVRQLAIPNTVTNHLTAYVFRIMMNRDEFVRTDIAQFDGLGAAQNPSWKNKRNVWKNFVKTLGAWFS